MTILKRILAYLFWTFISILCVFGYLRILLGPKPKTFKGILYILNIFYDYAFFHIGAMIGLGIAIVFILMDILYLNKRLKNIKKASLIRFVILISTTVIVAVTHYI